MASAVLATPSHADEATAARRPEFINKEAVETLGQAAKELRAALVNERNQAKQLALYAAFQFSPELRPRLKEIFGTERPFPLERAPDSVKGQINYVGKLAPYTYKQDNGTDFSWTELVSNFSTDKAGRTLSTDASWPSLLVTRPAGSFSMVNMSMVSKQQRGADNVGYGSASFKVGVMTFRDTPAGASESREVARLEDLEMRSDVSRKGAMAEIGYRTSINAIVVGEERVERSNFAFRVTNIPAKAMADLDKVLRAQQDSKLAPEAQHKQMMANLGEFGKRAAVAGATLVIDDISASYRGNTASIKGRIGFRKAVEADFKNVVTLLKKLVARFDVRVPLALVKDIGRAFAAKGVDPSAPDAARQLDAGADAVVSMVVGKAVSGGYAVVENNELRSTIELKDSKLRINGKEIEVARQLAALSGTIAKAKAKADAEEK